MKPLILITLLASCGSIDAGPRIAATDAFDAATTAAGLSAGLSEANPAFSWAGPATPIVMLGGKYAAKWGLIELGVQPRTANRTVETASMFAGCHNLTILAAAAGPAPILVGAMCSFAYFSETKG